MSFDMRGLLLFLILAQASCVAPGANPGSTAGEPAGGGAAGVYAGAGDETISAASGGDTTDDTPDSDGSKGDPSGFRRDPTVFAAAPAGGMQSGNVDPLGGDPKGLMLKIALGQQVTTCRIPTELKNVHVRGRIGTIPGNFGIVPNDDGFNSAVTADMIGLRLRVVYPKGPNNFYYKDVDFLSVLPSADGSPVMTTQHPPLAFFDFDVVTSDPSQLRYMSFSPLPNQPGTTEKPCQGTDCTDDTLHPLAIFNRMEISDPEHLPPCIEPKMEIYNRS